MLANHHLVARIRYITTFNLDMVDIRAKWRDMWGDSVDAFLQLVGAHPAEEYGLLDILERLLPCTADVDPRENGGSTPLT